VGEVYGEEISKAHVSLAKHFAYVLGTKPNHSQGIGSVSITKRKCRETICSKSSGECTKRANNNNND